VGTFGEIGQINATFFCSTKYTTELGAENGKKLPSALERKRHNRMEKRKIEAI
jgi:hypothetical protein